MSKTKTFRENVAEEMIRHLEEGTAPWQKPWEPGVSHARPFNPITNKPYHGINSVILDMSEHEDPRWMTFRQAKALGAQVQGGKKATKVEYWKWTDTKPVLDDNKQPVMGEDGKPKTETVKLDRPQVFYANVFNAEQIDGLEPYQAPALQFDPVDHAEDLLAQSGIEIIHNQEDRAFYGTRQDKIYLPDKAAFPTAYDYYSTALHEVGHATGHKSRMNREFGPYGSEAYAKEELRAEMSSYLVSREAGLGHNPERHASYVDSWVKAIKEDRNFLFQAALDAERIKTWVQEPEKRQQLEMAMQIKAENKEREKVEKVVIEPLYYEGNGFPKEIRRLEDHQIEQVYKATVEELKGIDQSNVDGTTRLLQGVHTLQELSEIRGLNTEAMIKKNALPEWAEPLLFKAVETLQQRIEESKSESKAPTMERIYLAVPYKEKDQAKALGAKWDKKAKSWFTHEDGNEELSKWKAENAPAPEKANDPVKEFSQALMDRGVAIKGAPLMDGKWHRVSLEGEPKKQNASYRAFLDGIPNGQIKDFKTGETHKWVSAGQALSEQERAHLKVQAAENQTKRDQELAKSQDAAAKRAYGIWKNAPDWADPANSTYLQDKGVKGYGIKVSTDGRLLIPARDVDGRIHTLQTIGADTKTFLKDGRKGGMMHVIDPKKRIEKTGQIIVAEGYATAATLHESMGSPVVVAFDSGNLKAVAEAVKEKHPKATLVIAADDDHQLKLNVGVNKAKEAANAVGGKVMEPPFTKEERLQGLTDWNDLAQSRGKAKTKKAISTVLRAQTRKKAPDKEMAMA